MLPYAIFNRSSTAITRRCKNCRPLPVRVRSLRTEVREVSLLVQTPHILQSIGIKVQIHPFDSAFRGFDSDIYGIVPLLDYMLIRTKNEHNTYQSFIHQAW